MPSNLMQLLNEGAEDALPDIAPSAATNLFLALYLIGPR